MLTEPPQHPLFARAGVAKARAAVQFAARSASQRPRHRSPREHEKAQTAAGPLAEAPTSAAPDARRMLNPSKRLARSAWSLRSRTCMREDRWRQGVRRAQILRHLAHARNEGEADEGVLTKLVTPPWRVTSQGVVDLGATVAS